MRPAAPILLTFIAPRDALFALAVRPRFAMALLVSTAVAASAGYLASTRRDFEAVARQAEPELPDPELAARAESSRKLAAFADPLAAAGRWAGSTVGLAAAFYVVARLFFGQRPTLAASLAVSSHAALPRALGALLEVPAIVSRVRIAETELGRLLPASLAALWQPRSPAFQELARSVDIFNLWQAALFAVALAVVAGVPRRGAVAGAALGYVVLLCVFGVALPARARG